MKIWKKPLRKKVRTLLYYPRKTYESVRFVRNYARKHNMKKCKIKIKVGWICLNLIVVLNEKYVFKFPIKTDGRQIAEREKRITDALRVVSPIKIPKMEIIPYKDIVVRKYEFAHGTLLSEMDASVVTEHANYIGKQIAKFLYVLAKYDPIEIRDLKPDANDKPGFLYGWNHGDIWQNFMINPRTFDITYFIDWESVNFGSLEPCLRSAKWSWSRFGYESLVPEIMNEYSRLYHDKRRKSK